MNRHVYSVHLEKKPFKCAIFDRKLAYGVQGFTMLLSAISCDVCPIASCYVTQILNDRIVSDKFRLVLFYDMNWQDCLRQVWTGLVMRDKNWQDLKKQKKKRNIKVIKEI